MVDIHSATTEARKKKKKERKKQDKNIMSTSATQGGHNYQFAVGYILTVFSGLPVIRVVHIQIW